MQVEYMVRRLLANEGRYDLSWHWKRFDYDGRLQSIKSDIAQNPHRRDSVWKYVLVSSVDTERGTITGLDLGNRDSGFAVPRGEDLAKARKAAGKESITLRVTDKTWLIYYPRRVDVEDVMVGNVVSCCYGGKRDHIDWTRPPLVYVLKAAPSAFSGQVTLTGDVQWVDAEKRQITVRWCPLDTEKMLGYRSWKKLAGLVALPPDSEAAFRMGVLDRHIEQVKKDPVSTLQLLPHREAHLWVNSQLGYIEDVRPEDVVTIVVPADGIDYSGPIVVGKHDIFVSRTTDYAGSTKGRLVCMPPLEAEDRSSNK
jgi:hypothetical protein